LCIKLVNYWDKYSKMHGQQNVKTVYLRLLQFNIWITEWTQNVPRLDLFRNSSWWNWVSFTYLSICSLKPPWWMNECPKTDNWLNEWISTHVWNFFVEFQKCLIKQSTTFFAETSLVNASLEGWRCVRWSSKHFCVPADSGHSNRPVLPSTHTTIPETLNVSE